ncbi:MAG: putative S-layer protein [Candidatus Pacearchaeota archaeon]|nr:putative S-layer protein [Candidatus Pacearchaeota archaeon]
MSTQKKIFGLLGLFTLLVVSLIGFVSAASLTIFNQIIPSNISQSATSFQITFDLKNTGLTAANLSWNGSMLTSGIGSIDTSQLPLFIGNGTQSVPTTLSNQIVTVNINALQTGNIAGIIEVDPSGSGDNRNFSFSVPIITPQSPLQITTPTTEILAGQNTSIIVTNTGSTTLPVILSEVSNFGIVFNPQTFSLAGSAQQTINVIMDALNTFNFGFNNVVVKATSGTITTEETFQVKKSFCDFGQVGTNLSISKIDVQNNGNGEDHKWELLDEIEVEVEVENHNQDDDLDVVIELALFDSAGRNIADDLNYLSDSDGDEEKIELNINDGDEEKRFFRFRVPADFDDGNYKLAVKVYNDEDGEDVDCRETSGNDLNRGFYQEIDIDRITEKDRMVIVDDIEIDSQASCGDIVTGEFTVFNIGNRDQDRVKVLMRNTALNLDQEFEITNLDEGEEETIQFRFNVPLNTANGNHRIDFRTLYEYDDGIYEEESEDTFITTLEILGCTGTTTLGDNPSGSALITAALTSSAKAGQEMTVDATITNIGTETAVYSVSVTGFSNWASLSSISEPSFTLNPGQSKTVAFAFNINKDSKGTQIFTIQTTSGDKIETQEVEINIESSKFEFSFSDNTWIWIIAAINIILIVLIIVVAVRLSRR